jgi:hypothetical protein
MWRGCPGRCSVNLSATQSVLYPSPGEVAERLKAPRKCGMRATVSGVRIPSLSASLREAGLLKR